MDKYSKRKIIIAISGFVAFIVLVVVVSVIMINLKDTNQKVIVTNLSDCSSGISNYAEDNLYSTLYNLVVEQDKIEERPVSTSYKGKLRTDTCKTEEYTDIGITSYTTNAIIDLEEAGYSYEIQYAWTKKGDNEEIDLGRVNAYCLDSSELIYGEFKCDENNMVMTKFETDPILTLLPYVRDNYMIYVKMNIDNDGKQYYSLVIEYNPSDSIYFSDSFEEYIANWKEEALSYLKNNGVDLSKYKIEETYAVIN